MGELNTTFFQLRRSSPTDLDHQIEHSDLFIQSGALAEECLGLTDKTGALIHLQCS